MAEQLDTKILPLLPLSTGVVLPGMVVTLTLETSEAKAAVNAARQADDTLLLVPHPDGRYARVGTVAKIEEMGRTPGGVEALVIRGLHRALIGSGVAGTGDAVWVQIDHQPGPHRRDRPHPRARPRVPGHRREHHRGPRRAAGRRVPPRHRRARRAWPTPPATRPTSPSSRRSSSWRRSTSSSGSRRPSPGRRTSWPSWPSRTRSAPTSPRACRRTSASTSFASRWRPSRRSSARTPRRTSSRSTARRSTTANMPEGAKKEAERELGRLERMSEQSPEYGWIRTYLDWMVEIPWDVRTEDNLDIADARRILDEDHTGLDDVKDRIIEYLAVRKLRAGARPGRGRRTRLRRHPHAGRPARASARRPSVSRSPGRSAGSSSASPSAGSTTRPRSAGTAGPTSARCPGRIVRALKEAEHEEPGHDARRDRQGRLRLAGRPVLRAARGARPRAEPHLPRPLPGGRPGPVRGPVHRHRERGRDDPRPAATTGWRSSGWTATPRTRRSPSPSSTW